MESDISGRNKEMWITILLAVLLCLSIGYSIYQKEKTYRLIDRLLDSVLNREMIALLMWKKENILPLSVKSSRYRKCLIIT